MAQTKIRKEQIDLDAIYPVGAIYLSVSSTSPATLFGGTWSAFGAGKTLVGLDSGDADFDTAEETGGSKTHTLTTAEMPSHSHSTVSSGVVLGDVGTAGNLVATGAGWNYSSSRITGTAGSGDAHSIVQPYITVYMWKRVS